jgi:hypothetical protein
LAEKTPKRTTRAFGHASQSTYLNPDTNGDAAKNGYDPSTCAANRNASGCNEPYAVEISGAAPCRNYSARLTVIDPAKKGAPVPSESQLVSDSKGTVAIGATEAVPSSVHLWELIDGGAAPSCSGK